jgi:hypothetical protein
MRSILSFGCITIGVKIYTGFRYCRSEQEGDAAQPMARLKESVCKESDVQCVCAESGRSGRTTRSPFASSKKTTEYHAAKERRVCWIGYKM